MMKIRNLNDLHRAKADAQTRIKNLEWEISNRFDATKTAITQNTWLSIGRFLGVNLGKFLFLKKAGLKGGLKFLAITGIGNALPNLIDWLKEVKISKEKSEENPVERTD